VNSKVTNLNLRAACILAALSLNLTASASLAQSNAATERAGETGVKTAAPASTTKTVNWSNGHGVQTAAAGAATSTANAARGNAPAGTAAATTVATKTSDLVALQGPTTVTQKGSGWKTTSTFIELKDGQQALPLTFTVTNGPNGATKLQGIDVKLNGREIITPKAFTGKDTVAVNLSDLVSSGQSQLIFQTYGPNAASCSWVLTTLKIKVTDIKPVNCAIGDVVRITGKNFPTDKSAYKVTVDQKPAVVKAASATGIDFIVPTGLTGGKKTVTLFIAGVKCDPLYIKVAAAPEVTGCNMLGVAPGGDLTITGTGFSTSAADNVVCFKQMDGTLVSSVPAKAATETTVTVTLPEGYPCPSDVLITVKTKNQESAKGVTIFCSQRVIDKNVLN
jgi:hypothetical protein